MEKTDTLGRRIQAGRRAAGLSQEALGERLEVSRQAVSKWESDAAVPELEKLVAMSRLFGVTLGALLGVEQAAEDGGALSEREIAAAEAIAERLNGARPRWSGRRRALAVGAGVLAGALVLALAGSTALLGREVRLLQGRLAALEGRVSGIAVSAAPQPAPDELLLTYDLTPTGLDPAAGTVIFRVSATPREQAEGASAVFTAQLSDGRRISCDAVYDQGAFVAEDWAVPLDDQIAVSITLTEGETSRTGLLETLEQLGPEGAGLEVWGSWDLGYTPREGHVKLKTVGLQIQAKGPAAAVFGIAPASVELCIYRNGEAVPEQVFPAEDLLREGLRNWKTRYAWEYMENNISLRNCPGYETRVDLAPGDTVVTAVRVTDNYGQTVYNVTGAWTREDDRIENFRLPEDWTPGTSLEAKET